MDSKLFYIKISDRFDLVKSLYVVLFTPTFVQLSKSILMKHCCSLRKYCIEKTFY